MSDSLYKRCKCRDDDGRDIGATCPDLRRGDGSWNPRHGTWYFALELPRGEHGKRRPRMRRGGFAGKDDAEAALESARNMIRKGGDPSARVTVAVYLRKWLDERPDMKETTRRNYRISIETYLVPLLGHVELVRLRPAHISEMFATIRQWNDSLATGSPVRAFQRHVGPAAQQRHLAVLRVALSDAYAAGRIEFNPAAEKRVRMAKVTRWRPQAWTRASAEAFWDAYRERLAASTSTRGDRAFLAWRSMDLRPAPSMVWTQRDAGRFLDYASGDRLAPLLELIMFTGIRRGEACGLRWEDVDLDAPVIRIGPTRVQAGWKVVTTPAKTEASRRVVPLDKRTAGLIRAWKTRQSRERLAFGEAWHNSGLVFTREDGVPLHPNFVTSTFERLAFAAGLPPIRLHDLRHGWATYARSSGVDAKVVQERLGHSSIKITNDTYTTVLEEVAREAAETVALSIPRAAR